MQKIIYVIVFLLSAYFCEAQQTLSLDECLELSEKNAPQATNLPLIQQTADLQVKILNSNFLPQTSIGGQATWQSEVTSIGISLPNVNIQPPPKDQYKATLDVVQNIWDGGVTNKQVSVAKLNAKVEEQKVVTELFQVKEQVSALYFGILFAEKQIANAQILQKELLNKLDKVKVSVANGVAIKSNQLAIEAKTIEIDQNINEAQKRKKAALDALGLLIGQTISENTQLEAGFEGLVNTSDVNRPELQLFDYQKDMLGINQQMAKSKNLPKIAAFATGGYGKPGLNFLANQFQTYFIGGVTMKIPLSFLYSGSQSNEIQQYKVSQQRIDAQRETFLLGTKIKVSNQNQEIARLENLIESDKRLLTIREQIKVTAEAQLDNGVITANDYLTEVDNENISRQNSILHNIQLLQAKHNLKLITGNLK
ncbi:TolC family protein [Lacihabitans sp. LS3-19]|uniref:TolC family protein n=1 Tax=Lacihabitans sp. LS3-19 TaxID=2487335 RepID=UPI0020CEBE3B|nr:TolC family protein [Lacihabitans sp. LS3-19]MCP9770865.1 TolC family protein [Lacihabitans sp. LS3-19]